VSAKYAARVNALKSPFLTVAHEKHEESETERKITFSADLVCFAGIFTFHPHSTFFNHHSTYAALSGLFSFGSHFTQDFHLRPATRDFGG